MIGTCPSDWKFLFKVVFLLFIISCIFFHNTFNIQACHFWISVCTNGDSLLEVAGERSGAVVCHLYLALLARLDRSLGVRRNGSSAACHSLVDDERRCTYVGEGEHALLCRLVLRECAEVVNHLVELDRSLILLSHSEAYACHEHYWHYQKFLHNRIILCCKSNKTIICGGISAAFFYIN